MNDDKEHIHKLGNNMTWTNWIFANMVRMRTSWQAYCQLNLASWIVFNILIISTVYSHDMSYR